MDDTQYPLLEIKHLQVGYITPTQTMLLLDNIHLAIPRGKTLALVGESGSGKSLTALSILQLLPHSLAYGQPSIINFDEQNLLNISEQDMCKIRGIRISMVFQEPMSALNPVLKVGLQISEVMSLHLNISKKQAKKNTIELLVAVGIHDPIYCYTCYPHQLSGGMKQRVMIAMALAADPDLIIADEPTTAIDVTLQKQILQLFKTIQQKRKISLLFITHDMGVVAEIADDVAVMYAGQIVEYSAVKTFLHEPKHPYSKQLFAALPTYEKRGQKLPVPSHTLDAAKIAGCHFSTRCEYAKNICYQQSPALEKIEADTMVRCYFAKVLPELKTNLPLAIYKQADTVANTLLKVIDLNVHIPVRRGVLQRTVNIIKAIDNINLTLKKSEILAIVGESGCGKTTLAKTIMGLMPHTSGEIYYKQQLLHEVTERHKHIQMIFQDPYSSLNPKMLIADILAEGLRAKGIKIAEAEHYPTIKKVLSEVGLPQSALTRYAHEFSGGQRQRIAIARALVLSPEIIICDEPTSALDLSVQAQILNLLKELQTEYDLSYLFITHNFSVVAYLADKIAVMHEGHIVEQGKVEEVLFCAKNAYTKTLLAAIPSHTI